MNAPGFRVSHPDTAVAGIAAGISLLVAGLPTLLVVLFGWVTTLDFYLACAAAFALLVFVEEGEL